MKQEKCNYEGCERNAAAGSIYCKHHQIKEGGKGHEIRPRSEAAFVMCSYLECTEEAVTDSIFCIKHQIIEGDYVCEEHDTN